ncbi:MAG: GMC oxidoreductase [Paracoccaceae bacterium]
MPQPILAAQATGNLTVMSDTVVRKVLTDDTGKRATGVEVVDAKTKAATTVTARAVMLAASPVETIRLMLNSANAAHPQGLANSSGVLGRYFMDQVPLLIFGSAPDATGKEDDPTWEADPYYGKTGGAYIPRWENVATRTDAGFVRGYGFQGTAGRLFVKPGRPSQIALMGFGELLPYADNRVTLAKSATAGVCRSPISCAGSARTKSALAKEKTGDQGDGRRSRLRRRVDRLPLGLEESGCGAYPNEDPISRLFFRLFFKSSMTMGAAIHESGGARMGEDPKTSVLNAAIKQDVPNLFVTDASAFPTSGTAGTTLTVMALTVRALRVHRRRDDAGRL